uniref:Carboxylic ester hydrolase n=1 Tax=Culicoides sonorensis TaxID=179676 RepID=A0A336K527_CULSO
MTSDIIVEINSGCVRGLVKSSLLGDQYYSFQRIPYAKPPIGDLRFKASVPIEPWNETLDATQEGPVPYYVETHFEGLSTSEDCLHLNVYSKNIIEKLPIIVFIYGGAFHSGSSTTKLYGPDYLMQKDVVLVTFNYRLGPLGFMHFDDPSLNIPGNAGLKDQLLVLKWIQENIEKFGGDKNNVTLIGNSAGAGSVSLHLISEASKNLFHRAILMSGNAFCSWSIVPPNNFGLDLAKALDWNGEGGEREALIHLRTVHPEKLTKIGAKLLTQEHYYQGFIFPFAPSIETYHSEACFINDHPKKLAKNAWSKNIDIIFGYTSNEGIMDARSTTFEMFKTLNDYQLFIPLDARTGKSETKLMQEVKKIKNVYNNFSDVSQNNLQSYFDFVSDTRFIHGIHRNILSRVNYQEDALGKTYIYRFCYDFPTRNHHKIAFGGAGLPGATHADDLSYIFTNGWGSIPEKGTDEWNAVQKMVDLFTGFAIIGSKKLKELDWEEVLNHELPYQYKCLEINDEWKMKIIPEIERIKVWDAIYPEQELY